MPCDSSGKLNPYRADGYDFDRTHERALAYFVGRFSNRGRAKANAYQPCKQNDTPVLDNYSKKVLIMKSRFTCSPFPEFNTSRQSRARRTKLTRNRLFLHKTFFGLFGKRVDGAKCECSLGNLSPLEGWFFEIYFVRLIGTPNQHYSR